MSGTLAGLTEKEQAAVMRAEQFLVATDYIADEGAPGFWYDARWCARCVIELGRALADARRG